jgi:hypothetical protein
MLKSLFLSICRKHFGFAEFSSLLTSHYAQLKGIVTCAYNRFFVIHKLLGINFGTIMTFQGVYTFDREKPAIQVDTFCVHGSPNGYITGIRGRVQCLSLEDMEKNETPLEMQEMIREKCFLRFPTLPFIPKLPYDVIATDYDNFALVSGAKDTGFVQV